jgi:hypothetical protein
MVIIMLDTATPIKNAAASRNPSAARNVSPVPTSAYSSILLCAKRLKVILNAIATAVVA